MHGGCGKTSGIRDATDHVWLPANHKPTIVGTHHGIWRRIKLIPFDAVIPDAEQDKKLPAKLEGIAWHFELGDRWPLDWHRAGCASRRLSRPLPVDTKTTWMRSSNS